MAIAIGELKHRITIEHKTRGPSDGAGGYLSETWGPWALPVWAKIDPKLGREVVTADQVVHRVTHVITIRARAGITAAMRVSYAGRYLAILGVREIMEAGHWTELHCEEGAPS